MQRQTTHIATNLVRYIIGTYCNHFLKRLQYDPPMATKLVVLQSCGVALEVEHCSARYSTSQFVPLRVENNLKSVKQHILDYDFELFNDIRKKVSMSKVVQPGQFCYSASQSNLLCNSTMKEKCTRSW